MSEKVIILVASLILFVAGFGILYTVDWKIALGVFIVVWANNIAQKA